MATLLDAQKATNSAKVEEFVNKQIESARKRVRALDFFVAGLSVAVATLVFLFIVQMIDRAYETPPKIGYLVWGLYAVMAVGYLYWAVFRPSRREINPYYAARELELNVESAKNSLVNWVDLGDDQAVPQSVRTALGQRAAKDLKGLDLNEAIENKSLKWVGIAAGVLLIANVVLAFLPPTRTSLVLEEPVDGNTTIFNNQDVRFTVVVKGRIPSPNSPDGVRLRLWYNPEDPETYEERPLNVSETDKRTYSLTIPPRQVRMGFQYRILAGNASTPEYTVKCKIIPEFTGFDVAYEYPSYLKRAPEQNNDPNLIAPYGSTATVIAHTNRDVKWGYLEIEGQSGSIEGQRIEGQPDSLKFVIPFEKESQYRIWFTTTEGDKNSDPKRFRLAVVDQKPLFRSFEVNYRYPDYLRWKPVTVSDVKEPEIEAIRGTKVTLTAKTNRGVKNGQILIDGQPPIFGVTVPDEPTWIRFQLPPIDKDTAAKVSFGVASAENPALPKAISIRALVDQAPTVKLDEPKADEISLPANGTLELKGFATDDHGVDGMTLRMALVGAQDLPLESKPYRGGMSFLRKEDNSWPTRVDYKDFVKLPDIRLPKNPNFRLTPGATVEFWLEASDNATAPYGPNIGRSNSKRFKVVAPAQAPAEKNNIDKRNNELNRDQKKHEQNQDDKLRQEKRDQDQPAAKGQNQPEPKEGNDPQAQPMPNQTGNQPEGKPKSGQEDQENPKSGNPGETDPKNPQKGGKEGGAKPMSDGMNPDPMQDERNKQIEDAERKAAEAKKEGTSKGDSRPEPGAKTEPGEERPTPRNEKDTAGGPPGEQRPMPKEDPNKKGDDNSPAGEKRPGNIDNTKEEKGESKAGGEKPMNPGDENGQDRPSYGDSKSDAAKPKPSKEDKAPADKGSSRPEQSSKKEKGPKEADKKPSAGESKPERDVTQGETKKPADPMEQGSQSSGGDQKTDQQAGQDKPKERPEAGEGRSGPKQDNMKENAGEQRPQPKSGGPETGENRSEPKKNGDEDSQPGAEKPQSGPGQPNQEPGELDRENGGELDREVNSPNPKVNDKAKSDVERLMRDRKTREKTREKLENLEKNAKDQLSRKKAQDLRQAGEDAAKNYDQEKPTEENVDQLAKKLDSKDKKEREEAEQRIKDWQKDQQTKKDLEEKTDQLKKKDPAKGDKVEQAMNKPERKSGGDPTKGEGTPKPDEKNLSDIAKDLQGNDPMKKQAAEDKLEKMMNDPKTREQAKEKLGEMAKNAKSPEEKQKLEDAAKKADEMAKAGGNKPDQKQDPKADPKDLKEMADKLAGKDEQAKKEAGEKLQEMMKDPAKAEAAKKAMEEMAKNSTKEDEKKALEEMLKQANEMAKNPPKTDPKDLKDLVEKMKNTDPKEREQAKEKLQEAMKDPKIREQMEKLKEQAAKNMEDPVKRKEFEDMMRELAKGNPEDNGKPDPADPKNRLKAAELMLEKFKKNITDDEFNKSLNWTEQQKAEWLKQQETTIANLKKIAEKGDWGGNRNVRSPSDRGPTSVKLDGKPTGDPLRGGKYSPPPGYADAYKKFTEDVSGVKPGTPGPK